MNEEHYLDESSPFLSSVFLQSSTAGSPSTARASANKNRIAKVKAIIDFVKKT
jgi:hypothetical protein